MASSLEKVVTPSFQESRVVLELQNVTKSYHSNHTPAVKDLTFTVAQGETLSILGPSGCGKTTTLRLIAGFERPDTGCILLRGRRASDPEQVIPPEKRAVAMVFQDYALFPHLTVAKNIAFGLRKLNAKARERRVDEILKLINMQWLADRYPHQLSGGQQQRIALGRALAPHPLLVLLDEPFSNLDADMRAQMRQEVQSILREEGATTILVTHDQEEALSMSDKVVVLNQGRLEQLGSPEEVYRKPASAFVAAFVGHASFVPALVRDGKIITEIGQFPCSGNNSRTEALAMVKPEDLTMIEDDSAQAEVIGKEFKGAHTFYTVRLASGTIVRCHQHSDVAYEPGDKVKVIATLDMQPPLFPAGVYLPK